MKIEFTKMHGCGNDYVYIDGATQKIPQERKPDFVRKMSDRHFGIGGDGVIFINPSDEADFERRLSKKMEEEYQSRIQFMDQKNRQLQTTAEEMRLSILGRENKSREEKPLEVVEAYVRENTTELVDPLGVKQKISEFTDKRDSFLRELDTRIKVSNATTTIRI